MSETGRWAAGVEAKRDALLARYPDRIFGMVKVQRSLDFTQGKPESGPEYQWREIVTDVKDCGWAFVMDHQCDEFEIGGIKEVRQLVSDLQSAIEYCTSFDEPKDRKK